MYHWPLPLVLASRSPRRRELLAGAGFRFDVVPADIDERQRSGESPTAYVRRMAREKADAVAGRPTGEAGGLGGSRVVVAADTIVVLDGRVLGKPVDARDASSMLRRLSGRMHRVLTGVALRHATHRVDAVERSDVTFVELDDAMIDWYVATGEPLDKAGSYGIQGAASRFIERIDGSYTNVVGLPLSRLDGLLRELTDAANPPVS